MKFQFIFLLLTLISIKSLTQQESKKQECLPLNFKINEDKNYLMEDGTSFDSCEEYKKAQQNNLKNGFYVYKSQPEKKMYCDWDRNLEVKMEKSKQSGDINFLLEQIEKGVVKTEEYQFKQIQNQTQNEEKIGIILFGYSQTGKSSTINQLFGSNIATQGEFGKGESYTKNSKSYKITTQGGRQVLVIDTQGFDDNRMEMMEQDERVLQTELQQLLASFVQEISDFGAIKFYFVLTESLTSDTFQFTKNYYKLYQLLGQTALQSSLILATKYNPKSQDPMYILNQTNRLESLKEQVQDIEKNSGVKIPLQTFQTIPYDENGKPLEIFPKISHDEALEQEKQLFSQLEKLKSYPVQIFTDYVEFVEQRINELYNTNDIGIKKYPIQTVTYKDKIQSFDIIVPSRGFFKKLFGGTTTETKISRVKTPVVHTDYQTIEIKSLEDIRKMYMNDATYFQERLEYLKNLFDKYDKI